MCVRKAALAASWRVQQIFHASETFSRPVSSKSKLVWAFATINTTLESLFIMSVFRILFHFFKLIQFALGNTLQWRKNFETSATSIFNIKDRECQKVLYILTPFSILNLELLQDIKQNISLTLSSFNVKASREQFIGFNISKLRFEYSDIKCAEIKGKSKNDTNIEIRGSEEKKIIYAPNSQFTQPLSSSRCAKVIVQYK